MKKRILAGTISLVLLLAVAIPVSAEDKEGTTPIEASVSSTYTLTIPAETNIEFNAESTDLKGVLKVTGNVLPTQSVQVTATTNALHNSVQNTDLPYTLKYDGNEFTSADWNETELRAGLEGDGKGKELSLNIAITKADWNNAKAGKYEGSIVFKAALK